MPSRNLGDPAAAVFADHLLADRKARKGAAPTRASTQPSRLALPLSETWPVFWSPAGTRPASWPI